MNHAHAHAAALPPHAAGHPHGAGHPGAGAMPPADRMPRSVRRGGIEELRVVGLNWETASLEEREKAALAALHHPVASLDVPGTRCREAVLLSTCNRLELYALHADDLAADPLARRYFDGIDPARLYEFSGLPAARHLFAVAAGLQSMILGETEIFCQVKEAYARAVRERATGQLLNRAFHGAFVVAKQVRTLTDIGRGNTSYASAAYHLSRQFLPGQSPLRVLLLGAGEIAATVADFFHAQPGAKLTVMSRRESRARELAARFGCEGHALVAWPEFLPDADVVIGGLSLESPLLTAELVAPLLPRRRGAPLLAIDLSVPRNFAADLAALPGVKLVNIQDLKEIVDRSLEQRREAVRRAGPLLDAEAERLDAWSRGGDAASVMTRIAERVRTVAAACLVTQVPRAVEADMRDLRMLHRALMKLLMHTPRAVLDRFPEAERPGCVARLGRILCPDAVVPELVIHPEAPPAPAALVAAVAARFREFLELVGPPDHPDELAARLADAFVAELLAPIRRIRAASICEGHRRAVARDLALFLPA